jgi:hypothetical protein
MTATKAYALKGVNDDECTCSYCGKVNLSQVMWLTELDEEGQPVGEVFNVGTTCGKKLLKVTQSKINTMVKNFGLRVWEKQQELMAQHPLQQKIYDLQNELDSLGRLDYEERMNHPLMLEIHTTRRTLKQWIEAQEILIPV